MTDFSIPALYPPRADVAPNFASTNKLIFGWRSAKEGEAPRYVVAKLNTVRLKFQDVVSWEISQQGWAEAWSTISRDYPDLANAIRAAHQKTEQAWAAAAGRRELYAQLELEENKIKEAIEAQRLLRELPSIADMTLLGGFGFAPIAKVGDKVTAWFTDDALWVIKAVRIEGREVLGRVARVPYVSVSRFDFTGGTVQRGQRYMGGGFGLTGAAEGMVIASLLNAAASKTEIRTVLQVEADETALYLFTGKATPAQMEMPAARVRALIRAATKQSNPTSDGMGADLTGQLTQLAALRDSGALTDEEFAAAKARVLGVAQ